jgi:hypothetical protein
MIAAAAPAFPHLRASAISVSVQPGTPARRTAVTCNDETRSRSTTAVEDEPNMIPSPARIDTIRRRQRLGGLLNEYRPAA